MAEGVAHWLRVNTPKIGGYKRQGDFCKFRAETHPPPPVSITGGCLLPAGACSRGSAAGDRRYRSLRCVCVGGGVSTS